MLAIIWKILVFTIFRIFNSILQSINCQFSQDLSISEFYLTEAVIKPNFAEYPLYTLKGREIDSSLIIFFGFFKPTIPFLLFEDTYSVL